MYRLIILAEHAVPEIDVNNIVDLHRDAPEPLSVTVLIPHVDRRAEYPRVLDAMTGASGPVPSIGVPEPTVEPVADFSDTDEPDSEEPQDPAERAVAEAVDLFAARGVPAEGRVVDGDVLEALQRAVSTLGADAVIVLTRPHAFAQALHLDLAHRARHVVQVPLLHLLEHA